MLLNAEAVAAIELALEEGYVVEVKTERDNLLIIKKREQRAVTYKKEMK